MVPTSIQKQDHLDLMSMMILLVLCASWGIQQVSIKVANAGISPILQAGLRSVGATVLLALWMMIRGEKIFQRDGTLWWGLAVGVGFALEFMLFYWSLDYTHAARAVVFIYTMPFYTAVGAYFFIPSESLKPVQIAGLCLAFTGIVAVFGESLSLPSYRMLIGDLMALGAALFWGMCTVMVKASRLSYIDPGKTLLYQLAVSALLLPFFSAAAGETGIGQVTPLIIACILYQIVWVAFITYLAWFWLIRNYPASRLAAFLFFTPLFGVAAGAVFLNEPITPPLLLALLLVGFGIYLVNRPNPPPKNSNPIQENSK